MENVLNVLYESPDYNLQTNMSLFQKIVHEIIGDDILVKYWVEIPDSEFYTPVYQPYARYFIMMCEWSLYMFIALGLFGLMRGLFTMFNRER